MSIFNQLGNQQANSLPDRGQMQNLLGQLQRNPVGFLGQMGFNIPGNLSDPNSILNYLLSSSQVNNGQLQKAMSLLQFFR